MFHLKQPRTVADFIINWPPPSKKKQQKVQSMASINKANQILKMHYPMLQVLSMVILCVHSYRKTNYKL